MPRRSTQNAILLVANTSWYLYNFRRPLARALRARGAQVVLMAPRDKYSTRLLDEGFVWRELDVPRNRLDILAEVRGLARFIRTYHRERPLAAHHFTIKCVIYGTLASILTGVPFRINAVTGLGHVFLSRGWRALLLRAPLKLAYRLLLSAGRSLVIFQNPDDRKVFVDSALVATGGTRLIRSSGVDLNSFTPRPREAQPDPRPVQAIFASRLLREKGIVELMEAIRLLRAEGFSPEKLRFTIAGDTAAGNPSSISENEIQGWQSEGLANFVGHVDAIVELLAGADLVVLPSYREGTPRILLEACAMEKAIVTTDVPGCREVVEHGKNGLLVPAREARPLASAIAKLATDASLRGQMGKAGRKKVEADFSDLEVARQTVSAYEELGVFG
jgi:glycosyltransferase involved in cell wall biosynthesis